MTRVVVLPSDESGCGFYRMRLPAGAVQQVRPDWSVEVYRPDDVKLGTGADGSLWAVAGIPEPDKMDLLVMQRVATQAQVAFVKWAQRQGAAVVTDSDDAMWCIERENSAWGQWNEDTNVHWRFLERAAEAADITTVTTAALERRYGKHGRCEVLPNCVPADLEHALPEVRSALDPTPTVGWAGFTATHPGDLRTVGGAVRDAQRDTGCLVRVVGDAPGASRDWGMPDGTVDWVRPTPLGLPYYTALTTMDIGLVPLADSQFNRAKSWLKALEFAACGVAVIASPTPANRELAKRVPMILASTPEQWYDAILRLVNHPEERAYQAAKAREQVFRLHTYEGNAERWAQVWERAMVRRGRMSA